MYFFKFSADRPELIILQLQTEQNCSSFCLEAGGESLEREAGAIGLILLLELEAASNTTEKQESGKSSRPGETEMRIWLGRRKDSKYALMMPL